MSVRTDNVELDDGDYEQEARTLGWVPEEEFRGNKNHWVDAKSFVERGQQLMPLLKQNNKRLLAEVSTRNAKIDTLETKLANMETAFSKMEKHYSEANKRAVETAKAQLKGELKQAREDNDVDKEFEIQDKLRDIQDREAELKTTPTPQDKKPDTTKSGGLDPAFVAWKEENPWFDDAKLDPGKKRTKAHVRIAEDLRDEGTDLKGAEFFEEVARVYAEQFGEQEGEEPPTRKASKVETSSSRASARTGGRGKSFADLPRDAKEACWDDVEDFVGPDKRYKTQKEWETQYAKIYFGEV